MVSGSNGRGVLAVSGMDTRPPCLIAPNHDDVQRVATPMTTFASGATGVRRVTLARSGLVVPRIGVGLAHLHLLGAERRRRLIDTAIDLGLTHFDTAPFYGDGLSERALGDALRGRRDRVTITTKFGLLATPLIGRLGVMAPVARKARSAMRRIGLVEYPRRRYSPALLARSLERSLKALGTDYVDVLAIHEPAGLTGLDDAVIEALLRVKRAGMVRSIGVAGDTIAAVVDRWGDVIEVVQTGEDKWTPADRTPDFTYSLFSPARGRGSPPLSPQEADRRLATALSRRPHGAVIVQTSEPARLARYVECAGR